MAWHDCPRCDDPCRCDSEDVWTGEYRGPCLHLCAAYDDDGETDGWRCPDCQGGLLTCACGCWIEIDPRDYADFPLRPVDTEPVLSADEEEDDGRVF